MRNTKVFAKEFELNDYEEPKQKEKQNKKTAIIKRNSKQEKDLDSEVALITDKKIKKNISFDKGNGN